jgi:multidrug efflux pump subunit AcrA (membrane-fusion protein)
MQDVRSPVEGTVAAVPVDEGQLVAEEDEIARIRTDDEIVVVVTEIPGVVRELYAEPGRLVRAGEALALIDES